MRNILLQVVGSTARSDQIPADQKEQLRAELPTVLPKKWNRTGKNVLRMVRKNRQHGQSPQEINIIVL